MIKTLWPLAAALLLGLSLGACDDESSQPPWDRLEGRLVAVEDDQPLGPALVYLFDLSSLRYDAVAEVDISGAFSLQPSLEGDYVPVVTMRGRRVFHLPQARYSMARRGRVFEAEIPLRQVEPLTDTGVTVVGLVVDDATGEPIAGAQAEMTSVDLQNPNFTEFGGNNTTVEPITDENGVFEIFPVSLLINPGGGDPITPSLRVRATGYESFARDGWERSDIPDTVRIRLVAGRDRGSFAGRVVDPRDGGALAGVTVLAEWRGGAGTLFRSTSAGPIFEAGSGRDLAVLAEASAVTDSDGRYLLTGLPLGRYVVRSAPFVDDGFVGTRIRGVETDTTLVEIEDLFAAEAMDLLEPMDNAVIDSVPDLTWAPVPGADFYRVDLGRGDGTGLSFTGTDTLFPFAITDEFIADDARYLWSVTAQDTIVTGTLVELRELSGSDRPRAFRLDLPEAPASLATPGAEIKPWRPAAARPPRSGGVE